MTAPAGGLPPSAGAPSSGTDPRGLARRILRAARRDAPGLASAAYGGAEAAVVCLGARRTLSVPAPTPTAATSGSFDEIWRDVGSWLTAARGSWVVGYVGFDVFAAHVPELPTGPLPCVHLAVPEAVITLGAGDRRRWGAPTWDRLMEEATQEHGDAEPGPPVDLGAYDVAGGEAFRRDVETVKQWIADDGGRRLTIARRVELPAQLDLTSSLAAPIHSDVDRSFYLRSPDVELGGTSPELLARTEGNVLASFKASGTYPRSRDAEEDRLLARRFVADPKIAQEHRSSIEAMRASLLPLGSVDAGAPEVCDLSNLRHLVTKFEVAMPDGWSAADVLRRVMPSGADPKEGGLRLLAALDGVARGPYYGLVGTISPDGAMSFSQVLRTAIRDASGCHALVGAAVTRDSSAAGEHEETRLKLQNIFLCEERRDT